MDKQIDRKWACKLADELIQSCRWIDRQEEEVWLKALVTCRTIHGYSLRAGTRKHGREVRSGIFWGVEKVLFSRHLIVEWGIRA